MNDFDIRFPPTSNSLNRLRLEAAILPDDARGKGGYGLLSSHALQALLQPHTHDVKTLYEQAEQNANWALEIARTLGTRLGWLLATLVGNDAQTQQANPDKPAAYWTHWSGIRKIYLGGGLVSSKVGDMMATEAQATLQQLTNAAHYEVIRVAHPEYLPLMGAARIVEAGSRASILDFGGSYVKRAIAHYDANGSFNRLQIRDSMPNDFEETGNNAQHVFERMADIIVQSYTGLDSPTVPVSIAAYVDAQGQPRLVQGGTYAQLAQRLAGCRRCFFAGGERTSEQSC